MMYDSSDLTFKDFSDNLDLGHRLDADDIIFNHDPQDSSTTNGQDLLTANLDGTLSTVGQNFNLNTRRPSYCLNLASNLGITDVDTIFYDDLDGVNTVQTENICFNDSPTLLDENTVNEFLLPINESANAKDYTNNGPDLLALYSCVICHDIFTTEADLLDHTIFFHASDRPRDNSKVTSNNEELPTENVSELSNGTSFEADWLVCCLCERVLSTALECPPNEQLCCLSNDGKNCVLPRKLSTMFVCDMCSYLYADAEALDRHKISCLVQDDKITLNDFGAVSAQDTESFELWCNLCSTQFATKEDLFKHNESHRSSKSRRGYTPSSNKMWNCGSCNQLFATARELYRHKRGEDRPPGSPLLAYVCEECDKVLGSMCALHTHKKMHKVSKPGYPCKVCGRRFNQSGHLAIHMRMHTGERPYLCDLCPKAFKVKVERDDHRRTHTGERPFACPVCPKTFTAAARLREHSRVHTDQRPYRCDICGAAFRRPYARTVHTLIHTGQKPHECNVCGTAFRRSGDMWKHKRTLHGLQPDMDPK
ncbi:zinc finger protein ZFP2-like isoform X2 [Leptidea sinapis]|nr:zinc finger protein ZFP2-like isoform X2 [Leptidea sinapis]